MLYTRAVASGTVTFDYSIDGINNGAFGWFDSGSNQPAGFIPFDQYLGYVSDLVSNATASFSVAAGDYFGFTVSIPEGGGPFDSNFRQVTIGNFSAPTNVPVLNVSYQMSSGNLVLSWAQGILQSSSDIDGPFTNVPAATSPLTVPCSGSRQFYRTGTQ